MEKTLCFSCGGDVPGDQQWCAFCAAPAIAAAPPSEPIAPAPTPPSPGPTLSFDQGQGLVAVRRNRLLIVVVALLLVAGGAVAATAGRTENSPRAAAERYFDALADGDADAALALVATADKIDTGQYPLLSDAALGEKRFRPQHVEIGDDMTAGGQFGTAARSVRVVYRANGQSVAQELVAVEENGEWRLRLPFVLLGVDGQRGRQVAVNGVDLGVADRATAAFPGAYEAVATADKLLAESRASGVAQANGMVDYVAPLQFGVPELAGGAEESIRGQVRTALDKCAASSVARPEGCPFGLDVPGTTVAVSWSITTFPQVDARTDSIMWFSGAAVQLVDDGSGKVHWSATYTDVNGARKSQSGDAAFRINGNAQATPTGIQVSLT